MPIDINNDSPETALQKLKARESVLKQIEEIAKLGSWEINLKTKESIWSDTSYKIYGIKKGSPVTIHTFLSKVLPKDIEKVEEIIQKAIETGEVLQCTCQVKREDGKIIDLLINGRVIYDEETKEPLKLIGTTQDITEITLIKKEAKELSDILEHSSNEIYIIQAKTLRYLYVNKGACRALGYTHDELLQKNLHDINPYLTDERIEYFTNKILEGDIILNRTIHRRKNGSEYHVQSYIYKLSYHGEEAAVVFDTDISEIVKLEEEHKRQAELMEHQAYHDTLTRLPNRALFQDRLEQTLFSAKRNKEHFALLFIDLDHFKKINDTLGHHTGDEVLIETAKRFKNVLREEDTLSRLGGDEFTIILKDIQTQQSASVVAEKLINSLKEPLTIKNKTFHIAASIGISIYPKDADNQEDLIKFADAAMYKAKDEGRNNYQFYSSEITQQTFQKVIMENSLRIALAEDQFEVYFQPQYSVKTEKIAGMEALIRWRHPHIGIVSPAEFIPLAQESGLIIEIDKIVMSKAMHRFAKWYKKGLHPGKLSLNLSMKQLNSTNFIEDLLAIMEENNFEKSWLELEITEGEVMRNPELSIQKLTLLKNMGIDLAIDDFGTGYSSLSYLKKLPLTRLKIDRSFIEDIPYDEDDIAITKAIIALAKNLNLTLVAEGVETEEQKNFMKKHNCDYIQGFYYSKALKAKEIKKLLKKN